MNGSSIRSTSGLCIRAETNNSLCLIPCEKLSINSSLISLIPKTEVSDSILLSASCLSMS
jgi:hypothetical protein